MTPPTLYHVTNYQSAQAMQIQGLGLDLDDYALLYRKVRDYLNVPNEALAEIELPASPECLSRVWFYSDYREAVSHAERLGTAGVHKGGYLNALVKACAAFMKVPFEQLESVAQTLSGSLSEPVVLSVHLDPAIVKKPSNHAGSSEVYVDHRVDPSAIFKVSALNFILC